MISFRSTIPSFGAPLPGRTFDSEYVNQQVTTTTQVHSADFESATGESLCCGFQVLTRICWPQLRHAASGTSAQSKWDDWQTTWCTADVLVEREQESGTSNHWLAVNSKYCTNGAMFTFYPTDETHTVTMDVTFGVVSKKVCKGLLKLPSTPCSTPRPPSWQISEVSKTKCILFPLKRSCLLPKIQQFPFPCPSNDCKDVLLPQD